MLIKTHGIHIGEYADHKHISDSKPIINYLDPEYVYIPLVESGSICEVKVNEGSHVRIGDVVCYRTGRFQLDVHSPVSGEVVSCNKKMWHSSGKMVDCIQIKNDHLETKNENSFRVYPNPTREQIAAIAKENGIVGLGGSGFPTYVKYNVKGDMDALIINGAECEPFITADYRTLVENAHGVLKGMQYIMLGIGAKKGYIAIKNNKIPAIDAVKQAISDMGIDNISVFLLKDEYPAGWEKYIVQRIMGKNYNALPAEVGAVVNNVSTAYAMYEAVEFGKPLIEKVVTFTGYALNNPQNVRVKVGTNVADVIKFLGGYKEDVNDAIMIAGGPMTGSCVAFENLVVNRALGSVIVNPKMDAYKTEPCMGCGKCAKICPIKLTPTEIKRALTLKDNTALEQLKPNKCIQCGLCSYVCPSRIDLTEAVGKAKASLIKK